MTESASQDAYSDAPTTITIDGAEYEVEPIRQGNVARVIKWVKSQWMQTFLDETRMVPLPSEDRGKTLAEIACKTPTFLEVLDHWEAKLYLLSLQIKRDGKRIPFDQVRDNMNPKTCGVLTDIMFGVSRKEAPASDSDPLGRTDSISTTKSVTQP